MRAAIFDLDGTLADTSTDLITAANRALGADLLDTEADAATAFRGGRAILRLGFERQGRAWTEADVDDAFQPFLDHYQVGIADHTRLYEGVEAALDRLDAAGWALGVCTNKPAALAEDLLQRLGVRARFAAMLGADSLEVRKPDPRHLWETIRIAGGAPDRAVLVGDSVTDLDAARNAGVACVLVTFGPEAMGVRGLAPEAYLDHYDDLDGVLARLAASW